MIKFKNINVKFNEKSILKDINVSIKTGEFLGILGPNGAGKTTFIKVLLGLIEPTSGVVLIKGKKPKEFLMQNKGFVGYLPQHAIVNWNLPIRVIDAVLIDNIKPFGLFRKYKKKELEKVHYWLEKFGIENKMYNYIRELSGGQQQRVSLSRCMINNPKLLILDEPNTAIDAVYNVKLYDILKEINKEKKVTIVMVSHDIGAVTAYVDEVMCLNVKIHCHNFANNIDYSTVIKNLYGEDMNIVVHGDECKNCTVNRLKQ